MLLRQGLDNGRRRRAGGPPHRGFGENVRAIYHETTKTACARHAAVADEARTPGNFVKPGEFSRFDLHEACREYAHSVVNESLRSDNPLIVSLAVLNGKVGRTRLRKLSSGKLHPLTRALLDFRLKAENIT